MQINVRHFGTPTFLSNFNYTRLMDVSKPDEMENSTKQSFSQKEETYVTIPTPSPLLTSFTSVANALSTQSFPSTAASAETGLTFDPLYSSWYGKTWLSLAKSVEAIMKLHNKDKLKNIDADKHVLHTYHDSFLFGELPLCMKIRATLRTGLIGMFWSMLEFVFALLSGVLYVYSTYHITNRDKNGWMTNTQNVASCVFVADYILRVYCEPVRLLYILSIWGFIDLLSAVPIIFAFRRELPGESVLHLLQFLRIVRILSVFTDVGIVGSNLFQRVLLTIITTIGFVFVSAGIMQWIEYEALSHAVKETCSTSGCLNFMDSFYFVIVTVATVGYGDVTPKTTAGKIVTIAIIIAGLIYIPLQISRINTLASRRPYGGSFSLRKVIDSRYIIITGSVSYQAIQLCLAEFYNPTHCEDSFAYPLRVNILAPFQPSFELKKLLTLYNGLVEFIEGSPVHQADLERVCAFQASAIFLLANHDTNDTKAEDAAQTIRALAVHRVCGNRVRILLEVLEPATQTSAIWDDTQSGGIEIICPAKIHYQMLSRSCLIKGFYTLITNLFTSAIELVNISKSHYLSEIFHSFDNEVYPVIFPKAFHNTLFEEVVEFIFSAYDTVLFALDISIFHKKRNCMVTKVLLHPRGHIIKPTDVGLVIARDIHTVFSITNYGNKKPQLLEPCCYGSSSLPPQYAHSQQLEETMVVESVSDRWKRTGTVTTLNFNRDSVSVDSPVMLMGYQHSQDFPDGTYDLETQLKYTIHKSYTLAKSDQSSPLSAAVPSKYHDGFDLGVFTSWVDQRYGSPGGLEITPDEAASNQNTTYKSTENNLTGNNSKYPKNLSLEMATEKLLTWPPLSTYGQPHPVVLEQRAEVILEDLRSRTLSIVELSEPHILLCCQGSWPRHLFYFIKRLRTQEGPNPPIVILHPQELSAKQWGLVGIFKDVFYIKGSPIYELDLMRGGILQVAKVVILANQGIPSTVDLTVQQVQDTRYQTKVKAAYPSDVDNILIAANVERLVGKKEGIMLVEMQHTIAFDYLWPRIEISRSQVKPRDYERNRDALVHFGHPFMEGRAVSSILLGFLMRSTFYNRNTISIVEQLVDGGYIEKNGCLEDNIRSKTLQQIPVFEIYINGPYIDLFMGLLREQDMLSLGLYRSKGTLESPTPYVFTNPPKHCIVNADDLV